MSADKRRDLREEYAEQTRQRILKAFADCLAEEQAEEVAIAAVAERAGVSERTVYRHFPTRVDLLAAAGEWINDNVFSYVHPASLNELPAVFREVCHRFDRQPNLAYAIALSRLGRSVRVGFRRHILEVNSQAIADATRHLPPAEARRAEAVLGYLDNVLAWATMREEQDMSGDEVADAVEWAMTTLLADLHRRNAAATPKTSCAGRAHDTAEE
ncbi:TetR/AcrR family transcriptional regulator [Leekyejoonella antrihumi]|uniref:TetR/AcrR family transcriptional regulator n=1 Tax=Leekyejoonella antrihumi TaxID=1660198 RepID=A0A563DYT4_9MICO|nr:TetR/AcrR family transcriptional regulator [Leekyejoonella antrihumi]TWP35161.1 TetR/AcrR family transcriptional regulator [Leekyejoonella antrihumi]